MAVVIKKVGTEFLVNTQTSSSQDSPTITDLPNGGFVVCWADRSGTLGDATGSSVKAQIFDASGARVGGEFLVNTSTQSDQVSPTVTALPNGNFIVAWQDDSGTLGDNSLNGIKAQIFTAHGVKVGSEFLVNTYTASNQIDPTITALSNGGFVVSWSDLSSDGNGYGVAAQVFTAAGTKIGDEFAVNSQLSNNQYLPTITGLHDGGFVVSWVDSSGTLGDNSAQSIKAQVFDQNGGKVGAEFLVNTQTSGVQIDPSITSLENGTFVVSWQDASGTLGDSSGTSTKAQVFSATGVRIGSEFLINTQTAGDQYGPAITGLADGSFVATWIDSSGTLGDPFGTSIKAQVSPLSATASATSSW